MHLVGQVSLVKMVAAHRRKHTAPPLVAVDGKDSGPGKLRAIQHLGKQSEQVHLVKLASQLVVPETMLHRFENVLAHHIEREIAQENRVQPL